MGAELLARANCFSCGESLCAHCRSFGGAIGSHPLVRTADARTLHAVNVLPQRIHQVDCVRSRGYGTSSRAAEDASTRPGSSRRVQSTRVGCTGNGRPRSPAGRTARTTDWRTGMLAACAATAWCRQRHHARGVLYSPVSGVPCSGPLPSTRGIRVSGRGYGVYAAWGYSAAF